MFYDISGFSTSQARAKPTAPATGMMAAGGSRQLLEVDEKTLDATRPIPLEDVPDTMALSNEVDEAQVFFFAFFQFV